MAFLYDLRATRIAWRTLRGDDARIIQRAAGHEKYATTDGYVPKASVFKGRIGDPFPALPKEFRSRVPISLSRSSTIPAGLFASPRGFEHLGTIEESEKPRESLKSVSGAAQSPTGLTPRSEGVAITENDRLSVASFVAGESPLLRLVERAGQLDLETDAATLATIGLALRQLCRPRAVAL